MHVEWYGQSAFALTTPGAAVFVDPFGDMSAAAARGMRFEYPPIAGVGADLLLVTHEHIDHNGMDAIARDPAGPALDGRAGARLRPCPPGMAPVHRSVEGGV
jgi:L-ascorbate metabolism protein UlaG (beta-lactamase superfamily)